MRSIREATDRTPWARASAVALATALAGCSPELAAPIPAAHGADPGAEPSRGGVLELASFSDLRSLDPATCCDGLAPPVLEAMFAGLVDYDADGRLAPDLAERWVVEDGGRTYRFFLREGVRFHDGEELTADDVKRSAERALHPTTPSAYASFFESLSGFADFTTKKAEHLAGIEVEGRYVVTFRLDAPDAVFLPVLALQTIRPTCRSAGDRYIDTWHPCGAGPFRLPEGGWRRGREIRLVRHDGYFRPGLPRLDGVRWSFNVNQTTQRFKLTRGELDVIRDFLVPDLVAFQADARWRPFAAFEAENQVNGESMNTEMPPFDNVEVRRAVAAAVDREQLRLVRATNLRVLDRPVPPGVHGYDASLRGQTHDLGAALEHMRRAGFPYDPATGQGGWPHPIPYTVYHGMSELTAQVLAQQLARIGLRIEIRLVSYAAFLAYRSRRHTTVFGPGNWQQDFPGALSFLEPLFSSRSINEEDSNNWSFYKDARVDDLLARARREPDEERRLRATSEAQQIIIDDAPWAFTFGYRAYVQRQPYVRAYQTHPIWTADLSRTWLDRAGGPLAASRLFPHDARSLVASFFERRQEHPR